MVINFKAREISRGTCKLARTPILIKKYIYYSKKIKSIQINKWFKRNKIINPFSRKGVTECINCINPMIIWRRVRINGHQLCKLRYHLLSIFDSKLYWMYKENSNFLPS